MKGIYVSIFLLLSICVSAQQPVNWSYSTRKVSDKVYEIRLTATINSPWHIYSQTTPDGGPVKTSFVFSKNPIVALVDSPKEEGKLIQKHEDVFDIDVKYYENKVAFVQKIQLKTKVKTNISGTVEYMVCNNQQCMPPKKEAFSIAIND